jgi:hypothetical protein
MWSSAREKGSRCCLKYRQQLDAVAAIALFSEVRASPDWLALLIHVDG